MKKRILLLLFTVCFTLNIFLPIASAEDNILTLNEAVKMALERNREIKIQELNVEKSEEEKDDLYRTVDDLNMPVYVYEPGVSDYWAAYLSKRAQYRIDKKKYEAMKQQMVVDVKELYYEVIKSSHDVKLAKKDYEISKKEYHQAQVKYHVGLLNKVQLLAYKTGLSNAKSALVDKENTLKENKTKLAILIGYNGEFDFKLKDEVAFNKADFVSLDTVVARALSQRYEIWGAERIASVADRTKEFLNNYTVGDIEADIKELEAGNVKDEMKKSIEKLYLSLQYMEEAYETCKQNVSTLEEKLRITKVQKEVGLATALDLQKVEQEYDNAKDKLKDLTYQYDLVKSQLQVLSGDDLLTAVLEDE